MRTGFRTACALAAAAVLGVIAGSASAKDTRCDIKTSDGRYAGPCVFSATKGGSFSLSPAGRSGFFAHAKDDPGILEIDVDVAGSRADVRGLTTDGINSRWGAAHRSTKDRACWIGEDFSICAY